MLTLHQRVVSGGLLLAVPLAVLGCPITGTIHSVTDTTQHTTVSTSGKSWLTEDGLLREELKLRAFTAFTLPSLQQDAARGEGEYVPSLEQLSGLAHGGFQPLALLDAHGAGEAVRLLSSMG